MVLHLSEKQRIEILIMVGYEDRIRSYNEVCQLFNAKYPEHPIPPSTVCRIVHKFQDAGHVRDLPRSGRPKTVMENDRQNVMLAVTENPHTAVRPIAENSNISKSSVQRILKSEKWKPYKVNVVHELLADDRDRRAQFCETLMDLLQRQPNLHNQIIFSDEATFYLHGTVNTQNTRWWSPDNPHWVQEGHTQRPQKVNVWAGVVGNQILGPYFFDDNLTADMYLEFLRFELIPALAIIFPNHVDNDIPADSIWFQQDGAPPHFGIAVRNYLHEIFPNRWIGRRGPIEWPPRSPDLTPLDYFLWGYLKSKVYVNRPDTIEDLKVRIRAEVNQIPPEAIQNTTDEFEHRLAHCLTVNGGHFEHLL